MEWWVAIGVALIGGLAGLGGAFLGAKVGANAARQVADATVADAQVARAEARRDAQEARLLQERREAIAAYLLVTQEATELGWTLLYEDRTKTTILLLDQGWLIHRALLNLILVAPGLVVTADRLRDAVDQFRNGCAGTDPELQFDVPLGPDHDEVERVMADLRLRRLRVRDTQTAFVAAAAVHLGAVTDALLQALTRTVAKDEPIVASHD